MIFIRVTKAIKNLRYLLAYSAQSTKLVPFLHIVFFFLFIAQWTLAKYVLPTVYSKICLIRHLKGNRKSDNLAELATYPNNKLNTSRSSQIWDPFVFPKAECLGNKKHKQKLLYNNLI